nr:PREDICTED: programmed cell death 1 ligand 1 [Anolis carolinensis]|eukprot:XP_003225321.1 PREDICTED: programmed cell death 1 ligand 1 [Anolis carolinensis]
MDILPLIFLAAFCCLGNATKKPHVQTDPSLVKAAVGDDVLLDCRFTVNATTLDLSLFSILWFHRGKQLAEFDDTVTVFKQGISLNKEELVKGNASLAISQVSAENSGKYRCYVTYSPEVVIREVTLQVDDPLQKQEDDLEEDSFLSRPCFSRSEILSKLDQITIALDQLMATLQEFVSSKAVNGCRSDVASQEPLG